MITANQILKKLQEKIWGKNKDAAEAAANSIKNSQGTTYTQFINNVVDKQSPAKKIRKTRKKKNDVSNENNSDL